MDEFGLFVNRLDRIPHGLEIYMDQSIYEWTSLCMNTLYDWLRGTFSCL